MARIDTFPDPVLTIWPQTGEFVVLDLEYTSWEGSLQRRWSADWEYREIVQVGALRLQAETQKFVVKDTFERLVKPVKNPSLSDHFSKLTGITNNMVSKEGRDFKNVLSELRRFVPEAANILSVGCDGEVLRENAALHKTPYPFSENQIWNIRPALSKVMNIPESRVVSCKLPEILGLDSSRKEHSALADALSIHEALNHLRQNRLI